jgi:hypothetical protein
VHRIWIVSTGKADLARAVLMEPGVSDAAHYARRVRWLAIVHLSLFLLSLVGFGLLVWKGRFFVTLSQRSNVETLTIAFFLVFFGYFAVVTAPGAVGAIRIALLHGNEKRKQEQLSRRKRSKGAGAAFDKAIEIAGRPNEPFDIELRDEHGSLGRLHFHGVKVEHVDAFRDGSNSLLGYVEQHIYKVTGHEVEIVQWESTSEEEMLQYVAISDGIRAIGCKLEADTWPRVTITEDQLRTIEEDLGKLCPALRSEVLLPDWEFEGEHKLPIIPEPLGIISLSRRERRVDPLSAMTAAVAIVAVVVALITLFIVRPPWIPGH